MAKEEAETTPIAPEYSFHTAMGNPQASQRDVTDLQAANHEAWQVETQGHLTAGPGAEDASKSTSRSASMIGSPHQPVVEMSTASLTSVTSSESPQEDEGEDEDAALARMVQAHMQLSSCNLQKEETSLLEGDPPQDTRGPASMLSLAQSVQVDAQSPSTEQKDASHGCKNGDNLQRTSAGAQITNACDESPLCQKEAFAARGQVLSTGGLKQQAKTIGGKGGEPGLTGQNHGNTNNTQQRAMRRKGKSRSARKKGARVDSEGQPLTCQVCKEAFDTRNLLFRHIKEQGHGRTVAA